MSNGYAICCQRGWREVKLREEHTDVPKTTSLCCLCDTIYCPSCAPQHEHPPEAEQLARRER